MNPRGSQAIGVNRVATGEMKLHWDVVTYIRQNLPKLKITIASLGEYQESPQQRYDAKRMGYDKGLPDLILPISNGRYNGIAIEFKSPNGLGVASQQQLAFIERFKSINYQAFISHDYDYIISMLDAYHAKIGHQCPNCIRQFKAVDKLNNHLKAIHRVDVEDDDDDSDESE